MDLYEFISDGLLKPSTPASSTSEQRESEEKDTNSSVSPEIKAQPQYSRLEELEKTISQLKTENSELNTKLIAAEQVNIQLQKLVSELQTKQHQLIEQIEHTEREKDNTLKAQGEQYKAKIEALLSEKKVLEDSNKQLQLLSDSLKTKNRGLEEELKRHKEELQSHIYNSRLDINQRETEIADLKKSISLLQKENSEKQHTIEKLTEKNIEYKSRLEDLSRQLSNFKQNTFLVLMVLCSLILIVALVIAAKKGKEKKTSLLPTTMTAQQDTQRPKQDPQYSQTLNHHPINTNHSPANEKVEQAVEDKNSDKTIPALPKKTFSIQTANGIEVSLSSVNLYTLPKSLLKQEIKLAKTERLYLLSLRVKRNLVSQFFKRSPKIVLFYNNQRGYEKAEVIGSVSRRDRDKSYVHIQSLIRVENTREPLGIKIGPLNKERLVLTVI